MATGERGGPNLLSHCLDNVDLGFSSVQYCLNYHSTFCVAML